MADEDNNSNNNNSSGDGDFFIWLMGGILVLVLLSRAAINIRNWLILENNEGSPATKSSGGEVATNASAEPTEQGIGFLENVGDWLTTFSVWEIWPGYVYFSLITSAILIFIIVYSRLRYNQILTRWDREIGHGVDDKEIITSESESIADTSTAHKVFGGHMIGSGRWDHILNLADSDNEHSWRQAVVEADIMLGELLNYLGYRAPTIGEQLQMVEKPDFKTLDQAWEAHKVRNQIVHEGISFEFKEDLFRSTLTKYKNVFDEFDYIY